MPSTTNPPTPPSTPSSGIHTLPSGTRHIPPSTRPDGSLRKEIKIRPGYRPPEDVEVYKNRTAEAWKMRGTGGGVPGADALEEGVDGGKKVGGKNAKRREARRRAKGGEGAEEGEEEGGKEEAEGKAMNGDDKKGPVTQNTVPPPSTKTADVAQRPDHPDPDPDPDPDPELEKEKQARALKKKLRQARELKEKKDSGEGLLPEQFAKVIKIQELMRQLDALGFDGDGARKGRDVR